MRANLDQLAGATSLESDVRVILVHDLYSGASKNPLTWEIDRFTSEEKQSVTRNESGEVAAAMIAESANNYERWPSK